MWIANDVRTVSENIGFLYCLQAKYSIMQPEKGKGKLITSNCETDYPIFVDQIGKNTNSK